jgi:hypothetical protein
MQFYLDGVGLCARGLPNWRAAREVLAGRSPHRDTEIVLAASTLLPPAERRRTTDTVKLAMAVGSEAVSHAGLRAENVASVFASSGGDGSTITAILEALASPQREVSPTRFHNSVHNAPSGYWSIATQCREASTSICAYDFSFAAGLLEAATRALAGQSPVLLVAYDVPYPPALAACRKIIASFGAALVISPQRSVRTLADLSIELRREADPETILDDPALEALRAGVPAARALSLLAALARGRRQEVIIPHVANNRLAVGVTPTEGNDVQ